MQGRFLKQRGDIRVKMRRCEFPKRKRIPQNKNKQTKHAKALGPKMSWPPANKEFGLYSYVIEKPLEGSEQRRGVI